MSSTSADITDATTAHRAPTPDDAERLAESPQSGPMLAADGTPLKKSLARAQRRQKLRALALIAPLLLFIGLTFVAPIVDMLLRSVDNRIVPRTLPATTALIEEWDPASDELPAEPVWRGLYFDLYPASEAKVQSAVGTRLNYEYAGMSSLMRGVGRDLDDIGEPSKKALEEVSEEWGDPAFWYEFMSGNPGVPTADDVGAAADARIAQLTDLDDIEVEPTFEPANQLALLLPRTALAYTTFARFTQGIDEDDPAKEDVWETAHVALLLDLQDLADRGDLADYDGPGAETLRRTAAAGLPAPDLRAAFLEADDDWEDLEVWRTLHRFDGPYTSGYFLSAIDMQPTVAGPQWKDPDQQIYLQLFVRTMILSITITGTCLLLGYPIAYLLANLPLRTSNMLMILVLLPFWTSLLVRTSAWIVLLQTNGVLNDMLVAIGIIDDNQRLRMMFNQTGTVVAMTHILLPFMILPLYSVMKTIPPSYVRAAKSLGATDWTAFWRVYFPQSVPGIGAGAILVFILAIGYYITPELVGGTSGIFISNRIAYHISSSLNWGLAAALGSILLILVLALYWLYDRIVGIDNVSLG